MLSSVIETDYGPSTGYTQTFQKPDRTGNQQGSEKQKYSAPNYNSISSFTRGKCGKSHCREHCQALGKRCSKCHWKNYFTTMCKLKLFM